MEKKEEYGYDEEENGCEGLVGDYKPYKVKYRIITEGETSVCIDKEGNTLDLTRHSLAMRAWNIGDFEVVVLGKMRLEHIDGD